jgi:hypothetical protein
MYIHVSILNVFLSLHCLNCVVENSNNYYDKHHYLIKSQGKFTQKKLFVYTLVYSKNLKEKRRYWKLEEETLNRTLWRTRFLRL